MSGSWGPTGWGTGRWGSSTGSTPHSIFVMAVDVEGKTAPAIVPPARNEQVAFCVFDREGKLSPVAGGKMWLPDSGAQASDDEGKGTPNGLIRFPADDFDRADTTAPDAGPDWFPSPTNNPGLEIDTNKLSVAGSDAQGGMRWRGNAGTPTNDFGLAQYMPLRTGEEISISADVTWDIKSAFGGSFAQFDMRPIINFGTTARDFRSFVGLFPNTGPPQIEISVGFGSTLVPAAVPAIGTGTYTLEITEDLATITFVINGVGTYSKSYDMSALGWGAFNYWNSFELRMRVLSQFGTTSTATLDDLLTRFEDTSSSSS